MKLATRLPLSFGLVLALLVAAALSGLWALNHTVGVFKNDVLGAIEQERKVRSMEVLFKEQVQEWKNVLLRGKDPGQYEKYWKAFETNERKVAEAARELQRNAASKEVAGLAAQFLGVHEQLGREYRKGLEIFKAAGFASEAGDRAVKGIDREPLRMLSTAAAAIDKQVDEVTVLAVRESRSSLAISLSLIALASIAGVALAIYISRSVLRTLGGEPDDAARTVQAIAQGDLTTPVHVRADDTNSMMAKLRDMQASLAKVVASVRENAESVASGSSQIAQGNSDLSARTEEQASALQQTAASVHELSTSMEHTSADACTMNGLAAKAAEIAAGGGQMVGQVSSTMQGIEESARKIAAITGVIDGIAFQTNILALNAAVEAARAGEHGRGFAVVASEVRTLATRSAEASREIGTLISASVDRVAQGSKLTESAGTTMQDVVQAVRRVTEAVQEITHASSEQNKALSQVNSAISQMDQTTQENAALVEESAAAAESLKRQSAQLLASVAAFRL